MMAATEALRQLLDEIGAAINELGADVYTARPLAAISGSIGEHVRHTLDHIAAFLGANGTDVLSYDRRVRGTSIESDSGMALRQIARLKEMLETLDEGDLEVPVRVRSQLSPTDAVAGWSTLGRELAFVASHTIHHQAMIAVLLAFHGLAAPERFGFAPSTPRR